MSTSQHLPQSNYHQVKQQKPQESFWTKWSKPLIILGNIVIGELTKLLLQWTEKENRIRMKYLYYYDNVNQQRFICKANETLEQILIDGTLTVIKYLSRNAIPIDNLPVLSSSTIPTTISLSLSFPEFIDRLDELKSFSHLIQTTTKIYY